MRILYTVIIFILLTAFHGYGQLMYTPYEAQKLKDNDSLFIGKPLHLLLKAIGAPIKAVFADSNRPHKALSLLIFKFVDAATDRAYELTGKRSLSLLVYVTENFDWDKPPATRTQWTAEDAARLGHLTVYRIALVGEHWDMYL